MYTVEHWNLKTRDANGVPVLTMARQTMNRSEALATAASLASLGETVAVTAATGVSLDPDEWTVTGRVDLAGLDPATLEAVRAEALAEVNRARAFRERNPSSGRTVHWSVHPGCSPVGTPMDEVAYLEFERVGMNLTERGKETWILGPDGRVMYGPVRDFVCQPIPGREHYCGRMFG